MKKENNIHVVALTSPSTNYALTLSGWGGYLKLIFFYFLTHLFETYCPKGLDTNGITASVLLGGCTRFHQE